MQYVKLSDAFELQMGKTPSRNNTAYWGGKNAWVSIADIDGDKKYITTTKECITDVAVQDSNIKIVPKNTVIMSFKLTIGKAAITGLDLYTNEAIIAFMDKHIHSINKNYLYHLVKGFNWLSGTNKAVMGLTLNKVTLSNIKIPIPTIREQITIANNLDKLEELISAANLQLAKLDELVKAKFVEMFGEKSCKKLKWNDIFETKTGKLDANAMTEDGEYPFFTCAKEVYRINKYAFDQEALLLAGNNAAGKYDVKHYAGKFNAYQRTYVLTLKNASWSYKLFQYQLEQKLEYLQSVSLGGLTKYLTLKILNELEFIVPPIELQNQFADYVCKVDGIKNNVRKSLNNLETLKKSLMQEYFG